MIAPVQNQLSKSMLTHIGIALTLGGTAAFSFWNYHALSHRAIRAEYYAKLRANKDQ